MAVVSASPAAAHHGWDGFETDNLVYIAGTVSSDGSWGEPHSYFDVDLNSDLPTHTPELEIPEELQDPEDSVRVNAALTYAGPNNELEVIIAPPSWSGRWGLDRALNIGESFQAVGYINRTDAGLFRPVVFWYGDDNVTVNQVLGNTLPVRAPLPGSDPSDEGASASASSAPDPLETQIPATDASTAPAPAPAAEGGGTWLVWTVFGIVIIAAVGGGVVYVRRRTMQGGVEDA